MTEGAFRLVVLDDYQKVAHAFADWGSLGHGVRVTFVHHRVADPEKLVALLSDADGIIAMRERTTFPRHVMERLPRLRLLVTTGSANAAIDMAAAAHLGITVCGTGSLPAPVVELTWALILGLVRGVPTDSADVRAGGWQSLVGGDVAGRTLGVLGPGRIGSRVIAVGRALGMRVTAWSPNLTADRARALDVEFSASLPDLLERTDVLSVHLRLTPFSRGLIGSAELAMLPRGAYLVNTARAAIADESALLAALDSGHLAGAALDVFGEEPLPPESPLRRHTRILATSHMGYVSEANYREFYGQALQDVTAFLAGRPIRTIVAN